MKKSFYNFMLTQIGREDPIGDFAQDMKDDSRAPRKANTLSEWDGHLILRSACSEARKALKESWKLYKAVYTK